MTLRRLGRWGSFGTARTHRLAEAFVSLPDGEFRWFRIGRFNVIIDPKKRG